MISDTALVKTDQAYVNVRVFHHPNFDVDGYVNHLFDTDEAYMVALHVHGRNQKKHWHFVGVQKAKSHLGFEHPLEGKPINKKSKEKFPGKSYLHFPYVLKPKEYATGNCLTTTNLTDEEVEFWVSYSSRYVEENCIDMPTHLSKLDPLPDEEPSHYSARLIDHAMGKIGKEGKMPGPWLTHQVRHAMYKKSERFHPYFHAKYA